MEREEKEDRGGGREGGREGEDEAGWGKVRERLVGVGGERGGGEANGGGLMNGGPLCHRCDGQLQPERAPMRRRWSVQCFEWPENIPPSSICIEEQKSPPSAQLRAALGGLPCTSVELH